VAFTTTQLNYLARQDEMLAPIFVGVFAADELPSNPKKRLPQAYIVNTDPRTKPGTHWIAIYTERGQCELMDSYGIPYHWYQSPFQHWIDTHWEKVRSNAMKLQTIQSNSCGQSALMYLKYKARGKSMEDFQNQFQAYDYVYNDHKIEQIIKRVIVNELFYPSHRLDKDQTNEHSL